MKFTKIILSLLIISIFTSCENTQNQVEEKNESTNLDSASLSISFYNKSKMLIENGKIMDALTNLDSSLLYNKTNSKANYCYGFCLSALSKDSLAIKYFDLAIQYEPDYAAAFFGRANANFILKRYNEALSDYNFCIKTNSNFSDAIMNRAFCKLNLNLKESACEDFNLALQKGDNKAQTFLQKYCY